MCLINRVYALILKTDKCISSVIFMPGIKPRAGEAGFSVPRQNISGTWAQKGCKVVHFHEEELLPFFKTIELSGSYLV